MFTQEIMNTHVMHVVYLDYFIGAKLERHVNNYFHLREC